MTEKVIETVNGWYMENPKQKVELDDIVGLVKTDEPTDSVQLKKEAQLSICEKRIIELEKENEQLKNKIGVLEDDNETYHKSLEKLNLYTKRFIPTKCTNEFKDCKTNRYYWLDHEGNFEGCLELLNLLDCENEVLKSENRQLKGRLMGYEEQIKGDVE